MNVHHNTVLITGGGSGIGFETAKAFAEAGNLVIISGRNETKLRKAAATLNNVAAIPCDITREEEVDQLVHRIRSEYGNLNVLVNNAGVAHEYMFAPDAGAFAKAQEEIGTNYLSNIRLTEKLLPLLRQQPEAAIINISSITAYTPGASVPTYSASKAALHSYTQSLRLLLSRTSNIKVFEVLPPLVDTDFSRQLSGDKMPASQVAKDILEGLSNDVFEIRSGFTATFYQLYLQSPDKAFRILNHIDN